MEIGIFNQHSWNSFFGIALILLAQYFLLSFTARLLQKVYFLGRAQERVSRIVHYILLIFEPLSILILGSVFLMVNPVIHGAFLVLLILIGHPYIRNYMNGRMVQANKNLAVGVKIQTNGLRGIVKRMNRFGIYLQNKKGQHYIIYNRIVDNGYTLVAGKEIGGFYQLEIKPLEGGAKKNHLLFLRDSLSTTPYIDWHQKPDIREIENTDALMIDARVLLKEESHLQDLMALIREWGYQVRVQK